MSETDLTHLGLGGQEKLRDEEIQIYELPITDSRRIDKIIADYVNDYEFRGEDGEGRDGAYAPSEREQMLLMDCCMGLSEELLEGFRAETAKLRGILQSSFDALKASHSYLEGNPYMKGDELAVVVEETIKELERTLVDTGTEGRG